MSLQSRKRLGFSDTPLYPRSDPPLFHFQYLKERASFWIAALSILAFVAGNMLGQHGWYAFWRSVLGGYDDSLIAAYDGMVPPIQHVPDFERWTAYGGSSAEHTYRQVPHDVLVPLPLYKISGFDSVYSIGHIGSYETGIEGTGSHPGIDIRAPVGTPVQAIANGVVTRVDEDVGGFGLFIVIRHPRLPDPLNPNVETVLHSAYAHLSAQFVSVGQIVRKGQIVGLSGNTGFVTGPHLHFQIDRDDAPWHPYWPFSTQEARSQGLTLLQAINRGLYKDRAIRYTINPMVYVQANYPPVPIRYVRTSPSKEPTVVQRTTTLASAVTDTVADAPSTLSRYARMLTRRDARMQRRVARQEYAKTHVPFLTKVMQVVSSSPAKQPQPTVVKSIVVAALPRSDADASTGGDAGNGTPDVDTGFSQNVVSANVQHDGSYSRGWEKVSVSLIDEHGRAVRLPSFDRDIYLRTGFGTAEFRPQSLSVLDFVNGTAVVNVLPRGRQTVVIRVEPFGVLSDPMVYVDR